MSLKERCYSVLLVVSAAEKLNIALSDILPESRYQPIKIVSECQRREARMGERSYDFVIINSPLPDDAGIRFAIDLGNAKGTVVPFAFVQNSMMLFERESQNTVSLRSQNLFLARFSLLLLIGWQARENG